MLHPKQALDILGKRKLLAGLLATSLIFLLFFRYPVFVSHASSGSPSILVGGQSGTWFTVNQSPLLYRISLPIRSTRNLSPTLESSSGGVWTGGSNGSQYLVSGWINNLTLSHGPHIYLFDSDMDAISIANYTSNVDNEMQSWWGGDILSASFGDGTWMVSGLGSGCLPSYGCSNHMGLGLFNGTYFTDLSEMIPNQMDYNLYANAFNGTDFLVGGGYYLEGVLYSYNPSNGALLSLTSQISSAVNDFDPITSIAWNGQYWLIGGEGFLAKYQGNNFTDLTSQLNSVLGSGSAIGGEDAVNSISWNGNIWLLGGGYPVGISPASNHAWLASYGASGFSNLTPSLPNHVTTSQPSSILTISYLGDSWAIGGYVNGNGLLLYLSGYNMVDLSPLIQDQMTYVNWVEGDPSVVANNSTTSSTAGTFISTATTATTPLISSNETTTGNQLNPSAHVVSNSSASLNKSTYSFFTETLRVFRNSVDYVGFVLIATIALISVLAKVRLDKGKRNLEEE